MKLTIDITNPQDLVSGHALLTRFLANMQQAQSPQGPAAAPAPVAQPAAAPTVVQAVPAQPPVHTPSPTPLNSQRTPEQVRASIAELTRGLGPDMQRVGERIQAYGVTKLSELSLEQLAEVETFARGLSNDG